LAYVAQIGTHRELFVRRFDEPEPRSITGSDGARAPFFSPDGRFVGFWAKGQLRGASVDGGALWPIADISAVRGASWGPHDTIVFADFDSGLWRVKTRGGTPERLTQVSESQGELYHAWPQVLPGGRRVLYTVYARDGLHLASVRVRGGAQTTLFPVGAGTSYVGTGHLVYADQGFLVALRFDPGRLELRGSPVPVFAGVYTSSQGSAYFAAASSGMLAYVPDPALSAARTLVWVDRKGATTPIAAGAAYEFPRLSPDGRAVAYTVHTDKSRHEVWVHDLQSSAARALAAEVNSLQPTWSPDGRELVFTSGSGAAVDLHTISADGSGPATPLLVRDREQVVGSWSRDGTVLAFSEFHPTDGPDLWALPSSGEPWPILASPASESAPVISPDGEWLAYVSDVSGRDEVYVRPFPDPGEGQALSTNGGREPVWASDGRELFYRNGTRMLAVRVETGAELRAWKPVVLFERELEASPSVHAANFDVAHDGQRFVMVEPREAGRYATDIRIVTNWTGQLEQRLALR
jgi:serine/threonine-protein kinase